MRLTHFQRKVIEETGLVDFPDNMPWSFQQVLDQAWLPESIN